MHSCCLSLPDALLGFSSPDAGFCCLAFGRDAAVGCDWYSVPRKTWAEGRLSLILSTVWCVASVAGSMLGKGVFGGGGVFRLERLETNHTSSV